MRTNFEELTFELNDDEFKIAQITVEKIKTKIGKMNTVTGGRIRDFFTSKGNKMNEARVRKIIQFIRISGMIKNLVGSSNGYYIADSAKEAARAVVSLREQSRAIKASADVLAKQGTETWGQDFTAELYRQSQPQK